MVESEQFARSTIDTVPETICVLDKTGVIIAVNQAWRDFYDANFDNPQSINYALGTNYLQAYESVIGAGATEAPLMAQGLAAVLAGERDLFSLEYPCDSPTEKRFFFARVKRFLGDSGHVLVAHGNITERKMLELELARMAQTDVLTGLNNRRHFIQLSETELSRTSRHGGPLSVVMLDIDHFKHINDTHGHQIGDTVIQMLAGICREQLRDLDVIGRLGGEEFAVTMPNADHAQAMVVAERLRQAIEAASLQLPQGLLVRFTVSIGVTTQPNGLHHGATKLDTLLDQADQALYRAKNNGRNQVCGFLEAV
jgi:diguanylate cyclase (GGDEF)-like protein